MLEWVVQHPHLAGMAIFLVAAAESLAMVGLFVPGTVVMFGVGALIAKGSLNLWPTLAWAAAGAVAGDGLSYWLGYRYRERLRDFWPFSRHPDLLRTGEAFFLRHGGKSVLLGRFVGPVRPLIPMVAGMLGMAPARFYLVNVLSGLAWAPAYILPGVVFGAALTLAAAVSLRLALLIMALAAIFWSVLAAIRLAATWLKPHLAGMLAGIEAWARAPTRSPRNPVAALFDPARREGGTLALFAGLLIGASWVLIAVLEDLVTRDTLVRVDSSVFHLLQGLRTPLSDTVMIAVTELGDAQVTLALIAAVLAWLLWSRSWRAATYWLAAVSFAAALTVAIKTGLQLPRPSPIYQGLAQFGFPSGHATMSVVVYGFLGVLIGQSLSLRARLALASSAMLLISLIAFSRLYLGAHWLSDVLGGLAFGTAWVAVARPPRPLADSWRRCFSRLSPRAFGISRRTMPRTSRNTPHARKREAWRPWPGGLRAGVSCPPGAWTSKANTSNPSPSSGQVLLNICGTNYRGGDGGNPFHSRSETVCCGST
jgi:membrane protein DedA with SNARE-associated domain